MIPGNAAYLEYMHNVTTGPVSSTGEAIAFPSYKPALHAQNQTFTPLETMFIELQRAVSAQAGRSDYSWYNRKISISLPLSFADIDYADRFEFDLLNSMLSLRYNNVHSYEMGAAALSRPGGICLPSEHPLIPGMTKSQQPLQRFVASATQALTLLVDVNPFFSHSKVRFACPSGPFRHSLTYDGDDEQPIKQLTIDGRLD